MATFEYSAVDGAGQARTGRVEAATRQAAIAALAEQRVFVTRIGEMLRGGGTASGPAVPGGAAGIAVAKVPSAIVGGAGGATPAVRWQRRRVGLRQVVALWSQLATALQAGLPLLVALRVVREQADHAGLQALVADLANRVEGGDALSDAMEAHGQTFSPLHVSMVRAGETAGVLDEVMLSLADFADRDLTVREQVRSAATYPAIVLGLAVVSVLVILTFILPRIMENLGDTAALPLPTRMLMGTADFLRYFGWLVVLAVGGGVWWFRRWVARPEGRLAFDALKLEVPLLGTLLRKIAVARFARALGTLSRAGIQIVESLQVLRDTLGNEALGQTIDEVRKRVTQGSPIHEPLQESGQFPPMFIQVVSLGEKTGKLDELLLRVADSLDKDVRDAVERTMTVLPSLLIVGLAVIVGFILAAVLLPIMNLQDAIPGA